ncbi:hypothetical protein DENIS_0486 [Desulfonema ishimotonii]|uniref:HlyC/CorC family transporter n=1 Tax=Desulfonema ishimotonii TaxID=45657 RepID=A0A401FRF7_9BACT|nr:hemolysin family protein [Desulfonema ishimotonii]GBC59547.1 hypothetical protein DENIS_0486 [Desulfonema ishimotonii]
MTILLVVVALTILISSQCSLYEAVLYSTRMGTLEAEKTEGQKKLKAAKMIKMKSRISMPLSAILILNTVANTAGATIAGMYASKSLGDEMVPLFSICFTLGILLFAEIIPKTMGALYWKNLWPRIIWPLTVMKYTLYPFIILTQRFSEILTSQKTPVAPVTEEDILGTIRLGARDGEISQWESLMLHNIINLETKKVEAVMTPRTVMFTIDENMTVEEAFRIANEKGFTRIPVYRGDRENIVGYVMIHDLSAAPTLSQPETRIASLIKPIMFVRENENCLVLLTNFLKKRLHIAMIGDEYGGVSGLVTLEDLIETVLGTEIVDENDSVVDLQKMARNRMQKRFYIERETKKNSGVTEKNTPEADEAEYGVEMYADDGRENRAETGELTNGSGEIEKN